MGVGAYKISGGDSGGFLNHIGASGAISAFTGLMSFNTGLFQHGSASDASKLFASVAGNAVKWIGGSISLIISMSDLILNCKGKVSSAQLATVAALNLLSFVLLTWITFVSGGVGAFLLNSMIGSFASMVSNLTLNIVASDAGC